MHFRLRLLTQKWGEKATTRKYSRNNKGGILAVLTSTSRLWLNKALFCPMWSDIKTCTVSVNTTACVIIEDRAHKVFYLWFCQSPTCWVVRAAPGKDSVGTRGWSLNVWVPNQKMPRKKSGDSQSCVPCIALYMIYLIFWAKCRKGAEFKRGKGNLSWMTLRRRWEWVFFFFFSLNSFCE